MNKFAQHTLSVLIIFIYGCGAIKSPELTKSSTAKNGMVVSANRFASQVGVDVLKRGGNAIDAAVAVQFALAVVYPNAGNLGGGGFLVYRSAAKDYATLDFREKAPAKAHKDMYLDANGNPIKNASTIGHLAAGVPGSVAGMWEAHQKYGKLSWSDLVKPAIQLAQKGFFISKMQANELNQNDSIFRAINGSDSYLTKKSKWAEQDVLIQKDLAATLSLISKYGRDGFYKGQIAEFFEKEMLEHGGLITKSDLANYQPVWRTPLIGNYRNHKIITMPPPSSGGVAMLQILGMIEPYAVGKYGFQKDSSVHLIVEAERRAYADRATHLGDPDFYKVPVSVLTSKSYLKNAWLTFDWDKATPSSEVKAGSLNARESEETTHFSIVDKEGNAVSVTTTLNDSYGSKVFVKGAGFILNDEMDDFSIKPGHPNMYGLIGGIANQIMPNKRMLSSMTPTIIEKDGKLMMIVGTPGGSTIITTVLQTVINVIDFGMSINEAVAAPRFHHQWLPDLIYTESKAIDASVKDQLTRKGFKLSPRGNIGRCDAIYISPSGNYDGAADYRGDDAAIGY